MQFKVLGSGISSLGFRVKGFRVLGFNLGLIQLV